VRLTNPAGKVKPRTILGFNNEALAVNADTANVSPVGAARFHLAVDAVVIQGGSQIIGYRPFSAAPSGLS
jgi:hypothetical protein